MRLLWFCGFCALAFGFATANAAPSSSEEGQVLGEEILREYNKDTTSPDTVKDINNLLDSLKNENQLSPETREILDRIQADELRTDQRVLEPRDDVDITRGDQSSSVFNRYKKQDENINRKGDIGFDMQNKEPQENAAALIEQGYRAMAAGQLEVAASMYKQALYVDAENKDALFGLAVAYQRSGQLPQARSTYSKLLSIDPENWPAMNNFLVLAAQEAPDHAIEQFKRLQKVNPEFAPIPAQIGMIYFQQKKYDDAANNLQRAIQLDPSNLSYRYNLAVAYDKLGRSKQAGRLYQQLLEEGNKGKELPESADKIMERLNYIRSN